MDREASSTPPSGLFEILPSTLLSSQHPPVMWSHSSRIYFSCLCVWIHGAYMGKVCCSAHVEVGGQHIGIYSLLLCGFLELNSGCQAGQQLPLTTGMSHHPLYHMVLSQLRAKFISVTKSFLSTVPDFSFSHVEEGKGTQLFLTLPPIHHRICKQGALSSDQIMFCAGRVPGCLL